MSIATQIKVPIPKRIAKLPLDKRGYVIPWFVGYDDTGEPDFRLTDARKLIAAVKERRCFICGEPFGKYLAFTVGPMCVINRTSGEPPEHRECAEFAVQACPFLVNPNQKRNPRAYRTDDATPPGGEMIRRNPGCAIIWITESYEIWQTQTGPIFRMGEPLEISMWAQGRPALRHEIEESIESGLPFLYDMAVKEGPKAIEALDAAKKKAYQVLFNGDEKANAA
jgi:hypothetical protein